MSMSIPAAWPDRSHTTGIVEEHNNLPIDAAHRLHYRHSEGSSDESDGADGDRCASARAPDVASAAFFSPITIGDEDEDAQCVRTADLRHQHGSPNNNSNQKRGQTGSRTLIVVENELLLSSSFGPQLESVGLDRSRLLGIHSNSTVDLTRPPRRGNGFNSCSHSPQRSVFRFPLGSSSSSNHGALSGQTRTIGSLTTTCGVGVGALPPRHRRGGPASDSSNINALPNLLGDLPAPQLDYHFGGGGLSTPARMGGIPRCEDEHSPSFSFTPQRKSNSQQRFGPLGFNFGGQTNSASFNYSATVMPIRGTSTSPSVDTFDFGRGAATHTSIISIQASRHRALSRVMSRGQGATRSPPAHGLDGRGDAAVASVGKEEYLDTSPCPTRVTRVNSVNDDSIVCGKGDKGGEEVCALQGLVDAEEDDSPLYTFTPPPTSSSCLVVDGKGTLLGNVLLCDGGVVRSSSIGNKLSGELTIACEPQATSNRAVIEDDAPLISIMLHGVEPLEEKGRRKRDTSPSRAPCSVFEAVTTEGTKVLVAKPQALVPVRAANGVGRARSSSSVPLRARRSPLLGRGRKDDWFVKEKEMKNERRRGGNEPCVMNAFLLPPTCAFSASDVTTLTTIRTDQGVVDNVPQRTGVWERAGVVPDARSEPRLGVPASAATPQTDHAPQTANTSLSHSSPPPDTPYAARRVSANDGRNSVDLLECVSNKGKCGSYSSSTAVCTSGVGGGKGSSSVANRLVSAEANTDPSHDGTHIPIHAGFTGAFATASPPPPTDSISCPINNKGGIASFAVGAEEARLLRLHHGGSTTSVISGGDGSVGVGAAAVGTRGGGSRLRERLTTDLSNSVTPSPSPQVSPSPSGFPVGLSPSDGAIVPQSPSSPNPNTFSPRRTAFKSDDWVSIIHRGVASSDTTRKDRGALMGPAASASREGTGSPSAAVRSPTLATTGRVGSRLAGALAFSSSLRRSSDDDDFKVDEGGGDLKHLFLVEPLATPTTQSAAFPASPADTTHPQAQAASVGAGSNSNNNKRAKIIVRAQPPRDSDDDDGDDDDDDGDEGEGGKDRERKGGEDRLRLSPHGGVGSLSKHFPATALPHMMTALVSAASIAGKVCAGGDSGSTNSGTSLSMGASLSFQALSSRAARVETEGGEADPLDSLSLGSKQRASISLTICQQSSNYVHSSENCSVDNTNATSKVTAAQGTALLAAVGAEGAVTATNSYVHSYGYTNSASPPHRRPSDGNNATTVTCSSVSSPTAAARRFSHHFGQKQINSASCVEQLSGDYAGVLPNDKLLATSEYRTTCNNVAEKPLDTQGIPLLNPRQQHSARVAYAQGCPPLPPSASSSSANNVSSFRGGSSSGSPAKRRVVPTCTPSNEDKTGLIASTAKTTSSSQAAPYHFSINVESHDDLYGIAGTDLSIPMLKSITTNDSLSSNSYLVLPRGAARPFVIPIREAVAPEGAVPANARCPRECAPKETGTIANGFSFIPISSRTEAPGLRVHSGDPTSDEDVHTLGLVRACHQNTRSPHRSLVSIAVGADADAHPEGSGHERFRRDGTSKARRRKRIRIGPLNHYLEEAEGLEEEKYTPDQRRRNAGSPTFALATAPARTLSTSNTDTNPFFVTSSSAHGDLSQLTANRSSASTATVTAAPSSVTCSSSAPSSSSHAAMFNSQRQLTAQ